MTLFFCLFLYQYQSTISNDYAKCVRRYPRGTESQAKHFLIKNTRRSHLRYESIRGRHYLPL